MKLTIYSLDEKPTHLAVSYQAYAQLMPKRRLLVNGRKLLLMPWFLATGQTAYAFRPPETQSLRFKRVTWRCATCDYAVSYRASCTPEQIIAYRNHSPCRPK